MYSFLYLKEKEERQKNRNIKIAFKSKIEKQLKKIAIDKDTSLSGLILDIITDYVDSGKENESSQEDSY